MILLIKVLGLVQGVGYRPFVARLAEKLGISGSVRNSGGIVYILAAGSRDALESFTGSLSSECPPGADVAQVLTVPAPEGTEIPSGFQIIRSSEDAEHTPVLPPDLPMCGKCRSELYDPQNRRSGYPFISCVDCGPRYSIIRDIPYDRETITMDVFPMCPACEKEYAGEDSDRRRHAQTISCHDCGPRLILKTGGRVFEKAEALSRGIDILKTGGILAVKGIGGYQLACLPGPDDTVRALRMFKGRDRKPFAVMFPDLSSIREMCLVSKEEEALLLSSARPIVLLNRLSCPFSAEVNGVSRFQGAFLPYTGLHQLLTDACGPLIMTSANLSDEPILYRDADILAVDSPYLSGVLYHTREILTPLDDSVARVAAGRRQLIRRSRGYVPLPVPVSGPSPVTVLAFGGDLKSSFCLYKDNRAYLSQYFGDMDNYAVRRNYIENVSRMKRLFRMEPDILACDLHPRYLTSDLASKWAAPQADDQAWDRAELQVVRIQHHHAHSASVMAEHGLDSCIGVAFDGTGYGTDGAVWGGEFLLCKGGSYTREAHLSYVRLCGGDAAARKADLAAFCYLDAAGDAMPHADADVLRAALRDERLTHRTSSAGRLFDAVSAVLGLCTENTYEGECAVMLENAAEQAERDNIPPYSLHFPLEHGKDGSTADPVRVVSEVYRAVRAGADRNALALGFHMAIVEMIVTLCRHIREKCGENRVALSGGVFANMILTETCTSELQKEGFTVYMNESVPANDGGISLGQAWICGQLKKTEVK